MMKSFSLIVCAAVGFLSQLGVAPATSSPAPRLVRIAKGWARNQINAVIFRHNSVITFADFQYVAFYDSDARVTLAQRKLSSSQWKIYQTQYSGDTQDAHKSISITVDGDGFLHLVWNQHNTRLQYCRSTRPGALEFLREMPMLGDKEDRVTYPEFHNLPDGNLLFLYRDGASGNGNLMLNRYDVRTKKWTRVQDGLISGEGRRNSYWQIAIDVKGVLHLSWVWRESPDVATNHDLCYAKSTDGGKTWQKSSGEKYLLPITAKTAEYVIRIPQGSELINQTSMFADGNGRPYIATYWRPQGRRIPQYHIVYHDGTQWRTTQVTHRTTAFSLAGGGTRRIPISRPQIVVNSMTRRPQVVMIFRDIERSNRVSVAVCSDLARGRWSIFDLTSESVGMWEPTYDPVVWSKRKELHLFVQMVGQGEEERLEDIPAQMISILEWRPQ
jgi:putative BNR repeat neuraminidase